MATSKVVRVWELRQVVGEAEWTIEHSYSDNAIEAAHDSLEIFGERLETLERELSQDELNELALLEYDLEKTQGD